MTVSDLQLVIFPAISAINFQHTGVSHGSACRRENSVNYFSTRLTEVRTVICRARLHLDNKWYAITTPHLTEITEILGLEWAWSGGQGLEWGGWVGGGRSSPVD